jgi:cytochrome P450
MTQAAYAISPTGACPYHADTDDRKSAAAAAASEERVRRLANGGVKIESFALTRKILRSGATRQAGFLADLVMKASAKGSTPVLFQEGEVHQKQRAATARFFAPRVVTSRYREMMNRLSDGLMARLQKKGSADLAELSMEMAVAVAADIIGLTNSSLTGMSRRLNRFFASGIVKKTTRLRKIYNSFVNSFGALAFYWMDVRPAINARKQARKEDLISHLIDQGYNNREILTECITYGAAGMVTTKEFIVMAAWHLLERDELRARFTAGDEAERVTILDEILRLEPIVGALYRRATRDLSVEDEDGQVIHISEGTLIDMDVRAANSDQIEAGVCPHQLRPDRAEELEKRAVGSMSFGDGNHKCPGSAVAMQETAIFLHRLFTLPGLRLKREPRLQWNTLTVGYELSRAIVAVR